jgi:L-rhamnose mutarotase
MSSPTITRKRIGQVVELKSACVEEYKRVHADGHPGVRDLLSKYGLRNFSIFLREVYGKHLLFLYGEYEGSNFAEDMARLQFEDRDIAWHLQCDPMQLSIDQNNGWADMECVYFNA